MAKTCDFKTSEASTKAWMRKRNLLTSFLEIPESNLTHFRQQNSYWSKKAFQRHHQAGIKPGDMLFYEEPGAKKVTPNTEMFHRIDADKGNFYQENLKYANDIKTISNINTDVKAGVPELFESNPELANAVYEALGFKSKPDVILPIGTSGSGKSTFIKSLPQKNLVIIEPDAMRVEFTGNMNDKSKDKEIYIEAANRAIQAIKQGKQVVFDTTNLTKDKRLPFIEAVKKAIPNANIQYKLMELNPELAKQRIKAQLERGENRAAVSDETIDRHAASYKQMLEDIKSEPISNFELTPQQKQQAQQLYSQYLDATQNQFISPNDKIVFGHPTIGKSFLKKQGEDKFITLDDDYANEVNAFVDANRGSETRQEYKGRKPKEYNEFMLNLYDRLKVQAQKEGKILFVSNTNILKERMSDFDKVINIPKAEFKRRFDERGATYGFDDWKSDIDATVAKVPSDKVITTTGYLADLFRGSKQDIEGFKKFANTTSKELSDKFVDDLYNLNLTPEVITYLYNENGSTHKLSDYGFMLNEMVNSLKSQNRSFVQILDDIKCL